MAGILVGTSSNNPAIGELGFKGERGYSAYEIAVQHGYIGTEDEWLASKNEKWQDEGGVEVKFFKGDTEAIEERDIIHGQLLYNTDSGETFLDYETDRINTGSGNVVAVQDTEPTNDATKLWINPDEQIQNIGTEVVNSMSGNETTMAPSVSAVKGYINGDVLYDNSTGTSGDVTLSASSANYNYLEIFYKESGNGLYNSVKVPNPNGKKASLSCTYPIYQDEVMYYYTKTILISGNTITKDLAGTWTFDTNNANAYDNTDYIYIVKVIGYN